jgi:hypothetical protein
MADVFISHIHEEAELALAVQDYLKEKLQRRSGIFVSSDQWQRQAGDWLVPINREITLAPIMILLLSSQSIKRPWVNFEAGAAWMAKKTIIPACHGDLQPGQLPKPYMDWQAVFLLDGEEELLGMVAEKLGESRLKVLLPSPPADDKVSRLPTPPGYEKDPSRRLRKVFEQFHAS